MKSKEFNNNILYVGMAHFNIINNLLEDCDFKLIDLIHSENNRCIKNIIKFDEFFNIK